MRMLPLLALSGCILGWDPVHDTADTAAGECGDNEVSGAEDCEGSDLDGQNCETQGFFRGQLSCDTCRFDTTECTNCGDGVLQEVEGEACDDGESENNGGYEGCTSTCTLGPFCGDGDVDDGFLEDCDDGENLGIFGGCADDCSFAPSFEAGATVGNFISWDVVIADLDGNSRPEIVLGLDNAGGSRVYVNDGSGAFSQTYQFATLSGATKVAVADFDGVDGADAYSGNEGSNQVSLNDGNGVLVDSSQFLGSAVSGAVEAADLDGDTDLDVLVTAIDGSGTQVWVNDGAGGFTTLGARFGLGWSRGVALGDLDDDDDIDAFVANTADQANAPDTPLGCRVWINDGDGAFTDSGQRLTDGDATSVALGDLDGDGDLDAFVTQTNRFDPAPDRVYINDGLGGFTQSAQSLGNDLSEGVALGDLDGDGDLDAFVAVDNNDVDSPNRVWLNDGGGSFVDSGLRLGNANSRSVALGDLDGDGDLDVYVGNEGADQIWLNTLND